MATPIGALAVDLTANSAAFAADMGKARRALGSSTARMNRSLGRLDKGWGSVDRTLGRVTGRVLALAGPAALLLLTKRSLEAADAIGKTADKVGLSTDALQEYRFAASLAGVEQRVFDLAIQRFSRRVGEAAQGQGELTATLRQYGVAVVDAQGRTRSIEAVLDDYADAMAGAESEQEKLRLAFKGFDSEGAALVNLFGKGAAAANRMREEARALGVVIDESLIRGAERANDQLTRLSTVLDTKLTATLVKMAPTIDRIVTSLLEFAELASVAFEKTLLDPEEFSLATVQFDLDLTNEKMETLRQTILDTQKEGRAKKHLPGLRAELADLEIIAGQLAARIAFLSRQGDSGGKPPPVPSGENAAIGQLQTQLDRQIASLQTRNNLFGESEGVIARANAAMRVNNALADQNIERTKEIKQAFEPYLSALARAADESARLREAERARLEEQRELERALAEQRREAQREWEEQNRQARQQADTAARSITSNFENVVLGADSASEAARGLARELLILILRAAALQPLAAGISGIISGILGGSGGVSPTGGDIAGTPFSHGGSFTVGGRGGRDANVVPLALTRGERVTVETPAQQRAASGNLIFQVDLRGASVEAVQRLEGLVAQLDATIEMRAVGAVVEAGRRGIV